MKKAKIMLSSLVVLAVVSGALAFKAAKFNGNPLYTDTNQDDICDVELPDLYKATIAPAGFTTNATFDQGANCEEIRVTVDNQ